MAVLFCSGSGRLFRIESCHRREVLSPVTFSLKQAIQAAKVVPRRKGKKYCASVFLRSFEISSSKFSKIRRERKKKDTKEYLRGKCRPGSEVVVVEWPEVAEFGRRQEEQEFR